MSIVYIVLWSSRLKETMISVVIDLFGGVSCSLFMKTFALAIDPSRQFQKLLITSVLLRLARRKMALSLVLDIRDPSSTVSSRISCEQLCFPIRSVFHVSFQDSGW